MKLPVKMTRAFHRAGFNLKKHSPEILIVAGVVGTVTSAVMACKATTKLSAILESAKNDVDTIHHFAENNEDLPQEYTEEDAKKDLAKVYVQTAVKVAKLYAPSVALGALSLTAVVTSNNILRQRNVALAAAYATVDKGYREYRGRVIERFGEQVDRELRYNIKAKEIEEKIVDENGEETTVTKTVETAGITGASEYARWFDERARGYKDGDHHMNLLTINQVQNWANDKLKSEGHLFLNDVYSAFGFPKTKAGQIVGWFYDEKHPTGDNYVDFGLQNPNNAFARDFTNGYERYVLLDFNVDGPILGYLFDEATLQGFGIE